MNRRGFFATLAALCAAPAALLKGPKAKSSSEGMTLGRGTLNTFDSERYHMPHECEWQDVPDSAVQRCLYCRDVRSRQHWLFDELEHPDVTEAHRREMRTHFAEFYGPIDAS